MVLLKISFNFNMLYCTNHKQKIKKGYERKLQCILSKHIPVKEQ